MTARVITRSPTVWYSTIDIDKGRSDGIAVNKPVIAADGLVGQDLLRDRRHSKVTLITDESSAVSAQVDAGRRGGIVEPQVGDPNDLLLDYIQKGDEASSRARPSSPPASAPDRPTRSSRAASRSAV